MNATRDNSDNMPVRLFKDPKAWAVWLDKNHATASGIWLRIAKKAADYKSVSYGQAVDVALCYGWIDSQKKTYDESSWRQKFTPRGPKSIWSRINRERAETLTQRGEMKPAGLRAVESAKLNGRWDAAYDSQNRVTVPADLEAELNRKPKAKAFFATLNSANRYAILFRIQTAKKPETRAKRIRQFIEMLEKNDKLYP